MKSDKITIRGKTYDLADVADVVAIQSALVPENWPTKKADGVRHFISLQNMVAMEFKRHFAANFKGIAKAAVEEGEEPGGEAKIGVSFNFEVNITAPQVAALSKTVMSFSVRHKTEGRPKTHDLNQGEFLDDDLGVILDTKGFTEEQAEKDEPPPAPAEPGESHEPPPAGTDPSPGSETVDKPKRKRKNKK